MQKATSGGNKAPFLLAIAIGIASLACTASTGIAQPQPGATARAPSGPGLTAFRSNDALRAYLRRLRQRNRAQIESEPVPLPAPMPAPPPASAADSVNSLPQLSAGAPPSITNTQ